MAYAGEVKLTQGHRSGTAWRHLPPPPPKVSPRAPMESWWAKPMTREQFSIIAAIQFETRMKVDTTEGITQVKRGRPRKDAVAGSRPGAQEQEYS